MKLTILLVALSATIAATVGSECECGLERVENRIIRGKEAAPNRYPWMVYMTMKSPQGMSACGGTIINDRFVMTAAHCVVNSVPSGINVYPLIHRKPNAFSMFLGIGSVAVKTIHIHREYYEKTNTMNDIALLEMKGKFKFNSEFGPVCLPSFKEVTTDTQLKAIGWGIVNPFTREGADNLRETDIDYIPHSLCNETLGSATAQSGFALDDDLMICAGGRTGVCSGDSGGPLFTRVNGKHYQVGIASFALVDCGLFSFVPGAFTRVTSQLSWIEKITNNTDAQWCKGSAQAIN